MLKILKNIGLHSVGVVLGALSDALVYAVSYYILINLLGSVPFIANLISFPVDYSWYAMITILTASAFSGIYVCYKICRFSKTKYNYGLMIFGIIYVIDYISRMIETFSVNGFSFSVLIMFMIVIATYIIGSFYFAVSEE